MGSRPYGIRRRYLRVSAQPLLGVGVKAGSIYLNPFDPRSRLGGLAAIGRAMTLPTLVTRPFKDSRHVHQTCFKFFICLDDSDIRTVCSAAVEWGYYNRTVTRSYPVGSYR
jgi:hypothetical protein